MHASTQRLVDTTACGYEWSRQGNGRTSGGAGARFPELAYSWRTKFRRSRRLAITCCPRPARLRRIVSSRSGRGLRHSRADHRHRRSARRCRGRAGSVGGHDWGAPVAWGAAQLHPDRVAAWSG
ncbi:putative epoxide hydrolase ephA [Mycobacterium xenopi 3993]|nr:putative epoxide hydrolase ephA [Mycobacterium xenopi 3993]